MWDCDTAIAGVQNVQNPDGDQAYQHCVDEGVRDDCLLRYQCSFDMGESGLPNIESGTPLHTICPKTCQECDDWLAKR